MEHRLVSAYGLTEHELLDLIDERFRLKVALEGGVAECQMEKHVSSLVGIVIDRYKAIDQDGIPDFQIWLKGRAEPIWAECKNARNQNYRSKGVATHYAVETQKTRAARGDPTSRYYGTRHFQILGVCLGKQTGDWSDFMFIRTADLARHAKHQHKIAVMHRVPIPNSSDYGHWSGNLETILKKI